jgi:fucose permease
MARTFIKTALIIYFHFPVMLIFLAILAAEQCVAVKLAADLRPFFFVENQQS